mgnify:CR=1 FL=1
MDKIWDRNLSMSEVIVAGMKTPITTQNRQKSNAKIKKMIIVMSDVTCVL